MSLDHFKACLSRTQVHPKDREHMPRWVDVFAGLQRVSSSTELIVSEPLVLVFLQNLRDHQVPAWQRLQAARALEWYQVLVLKRESVDFGPYKRKLGELAERETRSCVVCGDVGGGFDGEGMPGLIDESEPLAVRHLRARMRVLHHPKSTVDTYVGWLVRFIRHLDDEHVENYGEAEIGSF